MWIIKFWNLNENYIILQLYIQVFRKFLVLGSRLGHKGIETWEWLVILARDALQTTGISAKINMFDCKNKQIYYSYIFQTSMMKNFQAIAIFYAN